MTADQKFEELTKQALIKIAKLGTVIKNNIKDQASNKKNWAYVAEMAHIDKSLSELLESFPLS